jgi:hypothetical protein
MFQLALGVSIGLLFPTLSLMAQGVSLTDSFRTNPDLGLYEYRVHIPLGQTFVNSTTTLNYSTVRFHLPDDRSEPILMRDTLPGKLRTTVSTFVSGSQSVTTRATIQTRGALVKHEISGSMTATDDPGRYLTEVRPDSRIPIDLEMNLGYGSAWLDLTELDIRNVKITSAAADVYISYKAVGKSPVSKFVVQGGMSKVVVRNLEMARAENVLIENAMGDTKVIVGDKVIRRCNMHVVVGAGSCVILADEDVPVRIIFNSTMLSTIEIPDNFVKTREGNYVNLKYKDRPQDALTITVDPGIGKFSFVSYE